MTAKRVRQWNVGDIFLVPLQDGHYSLGQIVAVEPEALNSVLCAFYWLIFEDLPTDPIDTELQKEDLVALLLTTRDLLDSGDWPIVGSQDPVHADEYRGLDRLRAEGFVGAKIVGSGNAMKLLNAIKGLYPWDAFFEPDYLDKLLFSLDKKPPKPLYKNERS